MKADDELRSVRIEVESTGGVAPDVPVAIAPEAPSRWPALVGVLVLALLGVAFVALRPASDEAADGTVREQPAPATTSAPTTEVPSTSLPVPATIVLDSFDGETLFVDEPLMAIQVVSPRRIEQIAGVGDGFVALADVEPTVAPQLLASFDGINWFEIETQRFGEDVAVAEPADWFSIIETDEGLAILGSSVAESGRLDVLTSDFGQGWRDLEGLGPVEDEDRRVVPVAIAGDRIVALELFDALELETFLGQNPEVRVPRVCSGLAAGPTEFSLSNCPQFGIDADSFAPVPEVVREPDCAALTADAADTANAATPGFSLLQLELDSATDGTAIELPSASFVNGDFFPTFTDLGSGRVAVFDGGNEAFRRCDGSGVFERRQPGVALVDVQQNRTFRYAAPDEVAGDIPALDRQILGEVQLLPDRSHLVLSIRGTLWAIDTMSGRWTRLTDTVDDLGPEAPFAPRFAATSAGDRFLRIANGSLAIFELIANEDATIRATATVVPISADAAEFVTAGFGTFLHATDELIFYTDGITVWRLEIPAAARN